jgi:hypothetical protein
MDLGQLLDKFGTLSVAWQIVLPLCALLFVALFAIVFWMAGALANDERVTFVGSLLYGPAQLALLLAAAFGAFFLVSGTGDLREWLKGGNLLLAGGITLAVDLILVLALVLVVIRGRIGEGLFIWFIRLPLLALLAALTAGAVFVGLAVDQASREPEGSRILIIIGWVLAGVVALGVGIFFATRYSGPTVIRRPGS